MSVAGVTSAAESYASYSTNSTKTESAKASEAKTSAAKSESEGAVYEKSSGDSSKKPTYSVNKMSSEDRAALVQQLKQDQANRQSQLVDIVNQMLSKQATKFGEANDDFWKFLAKGDYTVDAATKKQAQEDISEDGYYGVKQTAQRMFDFASALAGDDEEQMKKMQKAIEKGFKQAEKTWGGKLPDISYETKDAVNKMFDDYYNSKKTVTDDTAAVV